MLTDELIARREVEDEVGARQCQMVARGRGCPHILTDLYTKGHPIAGTEELRRRRDAHGMSRVAELLRMEILRRSKPPLLVKLTVIGQERLGDYPENLSTLKD